MPGLQYPRETPVGGYSYAHFNAASTGEAVGDNTPKVLHAVTINSPGSGGTVTIYDGQSTAGTVVAAISLDVRCPGGLFIVITGATPPDITISYL